MPAARRKTIFQELCEACDAVFRDKLQRSVRLNKDGKNKNKRQKGPKPKMVYTPAEFHETVFLRHRRYIPRGQWPKGVRFVPLAELSPEELVALHQAVVSGRIRFKTVTDEMAVELAEDVEGACPKTTMLR